ncbi:hypothetical protein CDAR_368861 [Caerostris darwini]|uniref:Uncharacterized protein n=1 Tax=Caerostris darwini TaxID=1538125 RepID=A0AAV4NIL8_9ARAC|nr:hypothetical protein CDAR_368861 [Caerostris darwini]
MRAIYQGRVLGRLRCDTPEAGAGQLSSVRESFRLILEQWPMACYGVMDSGEIECNYRSQQFARIVRGYSRQGIAKLS